MTVRAVKMLLQQVAACVLSSAVPGQTPQAISNPFGVWRGTSSCLVHPSACKDEVVVYRITRMKALDSASIDAKKIVNGQEQDMGMLACRVTTTGAQLTCTIPHGTWRFTIRADSLVGELRLPDGKKFRDVRTARSR
jgi:hypothetical protein